MVRGVFLDISSSPMHDEQRTQELLLGAKQPHLHEPLRDDASRRYSASGVSSDGQAELVDCLECHYTPRNKRIGTKWVVGVCVVGLVLLLFRCHLGISRSLMGGLQPRGLGESGSDDSDDEKEPSSPDFRNLCLEVGPSPSEGPRGSPSMVESFLESLVEEQEFAFDESSESELPGAGDWHPMESPTDGPRASPIMVQSFFEDLEKQALAGFHEALLAGPPEGESTPGLQVGVKRPASDNAEDEDDVPGPSGKVARTGSVTVSTSTASSPLATTSSPSLLGGAGAEGATTHSDSAGPSSPTVSISASASSSVVQPSRSSPPAAASQSPSSQGGDGGTVGSVFLRVPTLEAGVKVKPFRSTVLQEGQYKFQLVHPVSQLQAFLRKSSLTQRDASCVVALSEQLANLARHSMNSPIGRMRPNRMAEAFGRRFLLLYMLDMASTALKQDWKHEPWWAVLAANLPTTLPEGMSDANVIASGREMWRLTKRLAAATEIYKEGGRPSSEEILHLMRKLFCLPGAPGTFQRETWDVWRQDAGC
ncbi:hypothetical protein Efla_001676 [Eimeria flavescens]